MWSTEKLRPDFQQTTDHSSSNSRPFQNLPSSLNCCCMFTVETISSAKHSEQFRYAAVTRRGGNDFADRVLSVYSPSAKAERTFTHTHTHTHTHKTPGLRWWCSGNTITNTAAEVIDAYHFDVDGVRRRPALGQNPTVPSFLRRSCVAGLPFCSLGNVGCPVPDWEGRPQKQREQNRRKRRRRGIWSTVCVSVCVFIRRSSSSFSAFFPSAFRLLVGQGTNPFRFRKKIVKYRASSAITKVAASSSESDNGRNQHRLAEKGVRRGSKIKGDRLPSHWHENATGQSAKFVHIRG